MQLYNRYHKEELKKRLMEEDFQRITISFYRYVRIDEPQLFRDLLYLEWSAMNCFGRIYVAREGINAQMSVPSQRLDEFLGKLNQHDELKNMPIKYAVEDNGKSFYKLTIKVRPKIVADGLDDQAFDVTNVGRHLSAAEFHDYVGNPEVLVVDMRNHYESEIGHFEGALCPQADTFREEIELVVDQLNNEKDRKILLYCTGGIRCEKASAYLKHHGFSDVNQLHGGIIEYARQVKQLDLKSKFIGKNFVFDERLGESINGEVIAHCHQCGQKCDTHVNCANKLCHILFIQCPECAARYEGCCGDECREVLHTPEEDRYLFVQTFRRKFGNRKAFRKSINQKLSLIRTGND
ncbi:rhodanese-related sulfurtransferase [Gaoshiqia sp. Z1-71]|uniref:oxygen-dependent tRNA uridine(34) hydroxylase TrhO n=1 Tax=Gaoshiqia hydrogeniformans TaxID=3290090 RepID=UPI003BF791F2